MRPLNSVPPQVAIFTCQQNESDFQLSEIKINNVFLKTNAAAVEHLNRTKLCYARDSFYFLNLSKSKQWLRVNLSDGTARVNHCPLTGEVQAVHYGLDELVVASANLSTGTPSTIVWRYAWTPPVSARKRFLPDYAIPTTVTAPSLRNTAPSATSSTTTPRANVSSS